jgi:hypothetical protein
LQIYAVTSNTSFLLYARQALPVGCSYANGIYGGPTCNQRQNLTLSMAVGVAAAALALLLTICYLCADWSTRLADWVRHRITEWVIHRCRRAVKAMNRLAKKAKEEAGQEAKPEAGHEAKPEAAPADPGGCRGDVTWCCIQRGAGLRPGITGP